MDLAEAVVGRTGPGVVVVTGQVWAVVAGGAPEVDVVVKGSGTLRIPRLKAYAPVVGETVLLLRSGASTYCLGAISAGSGELPPPPGPDPAPVGTTVALPATTGTYRGSGWRTDTQDLFQGDWTGKGRNYGAAYYGEQLAGLPDDATTTAITVTVRRDAGGSGAKQAPTLRLLQAHTRPAGAPVVRATQAGPALAVGQVAKIVLPKTWGAELIVGTAGGIGIGVDATAPYLRLAGRSAYAAAMAVTLSWTRNVE